MAISVQFHGAAQTVTGSKHLVRTPGANVLLDCGLFQGRRSESRELNQHLGFTPKEIDVVVLSHAHMDHVGALPLLVKQGYRGPIFVTPATRDVAAVMLEDAAHIQLSDAEFFNRKLKEKHAEGEPIEPLYDERDVLQTLSQMVSIEYHRAHNIAKGVMLTFYDAGHVLGSAVVALDIDDEGAQRRLVFSGDLGRKDMAILRDPQIPEGAEILIMESTYGDRLHPPYAEMTEALLHVIQRTIAQRGKVIIPSFALERAQEIVYALHNLHTAGKLPPIPVVVDSPLAVNITQVFRMHPECYDDEMRAFMKKDQTPFDFPSLRYISAVEDSKALNTFNEPCVIIAASGMCEAGRILHHLKNNIESAKNTVLIVGFQAQHTLGRRLVEKRDRVRIFGLEYERRAEVTVLNGFSAHADQKGLLDFAQGVKTKGKLKHVVLVHGEPPAQATLKDKLDALGMPNLHIPAMHETLTF